MSKRRPVLPLWLPPLASVGTVEHYKHSEKGDSFRLSLLGGGVIEVLVPTEFEAAGKVITALRRCSELIDEHRDEPPQRKLPLGGSK